MEKPAIKVFTALLSLLIIVAIYSYVTLGNLWLPLMFLLGGIIGPFMGISYPFPILYKTLYILGLFLSLAFIIVGVKFNKKIIGQIAIVLGIMAWFFLGLLGLGTGT